MDEDSDTQCKKRSDCTKPCPFGQKHRGPCVVDGKQVCAAKTVKMDTSPNDDAQKPGAGRALRTKHPTEVFLDKAECVLHGTDAPATTEKKAVKRKKGADKLAAAEKKLAAAETKVTAAKKGLKVAKAKAALDKATAA